MSTRRPGGIVLSAVVLIAGRAAARPSLFDGELHGTVLQLQADGGLGPLPGASIKLSCPATVTATEENRMRRACSARLRVLVGARVVAQADEVARIDYRPVASNGGAISLDLLSVDGAASMIVVRTRLAEGDMRMDISIEDQLFVVDGAGLRQVFSYRSQVTHTPGPDDREPVSDTRRTLAPDGGRSHGAPHLRLTTTTEEPPLVDVLTWNGRSYSSCATCKPMPPPTPTAATADASLVDAATGRSFEPLLRKVLAGGRLAAEELGPLAPATLARLRNAPYARHGRPFKNPELQAFFYAPHPSSSLPPLAPDPAFDESRLDAADRANIAAVLAAEKRH
jgi:hypothetical protein